MHGPVGAGMGLGDVGKAAPEGRKPQLGLLALELVSGGERVAHATDQLVGQAIRRDETGAVHRDVERDHANAKAGAVVMNVMLDVHTGVVSSIHTGNTSTSPDPSAR